MIENKKWSKPKNWHCWNEDGNPKRKGINKINRRKWKQKLMIRRNNYVS